MIQRVHAALLGTAAVLLYGSNTLQNIDIRFFYFEVGTPVLSAKEKADPMKYYHTCDHDIV
jgi:hypothetical protein